MPEVFVTPVHSIPHQRKDAASIWSEDVQSFGFKLYLREVTNFSGGHANIRVVSSLWSVFDIPSGRFSRKFHTESLRLEVHPLLFVYHQRKATPFLCFMKKAPLSHTLQHCIPFVNPWNELFRL